MTHHFTLTITRVQDGSDFTAPAAGATDNGKAWAWNSSSGFFEPVAIYTQSQIDTALALYYTKTASDARYYTQAQTNTIFAALDGTQTFTKPQTVTPSAGNVVPITVNTRSDISTQAQAWRWNNRLRAYVNLTSTVGQLGLANEDYGTGGGPSLVIDRNDNASTPASGNARVTNKNGTDLYFWPDGASQWRTGASVPNNANDLSGTIVGTQTSHITFKNITGDAIAPAEAMRNIVALKRHIKRFVYKSGAYDDQEFSGVILDDTEPETHRYGMDRDDDHIAGKSLNEITGFGDVVLALSHIDDCFQQIFSRLEAAGL